VLAKTTSPQLTSTWFSSTYWQVAGIAAVLTLPFLFAAAVQALLASDLSLLIRSALGYLPLALLAVAIAAPLTMLLLAASDQLSAIVSSAAGNQSAHFLDRSAGLMGSISAFVSSSFVGFLVALLTAAGAIVLWMELLVREAAVYVIVLMLPLAFAAFVWPARRIWAVRSIELLVALILSKFAIVAVLSLGAAALAQSANRSVTGLLAGAVLMALAAFAPWAMLRMVPLTELASGAAASLRGGASAAFHGLQRADAWTAEGDHWASKTAQMRRTAEASNGTNSLDGATFSDGAASLDGATSSAGPTAPERAGAANRAGATDEGIDATASRDPHGANAGGSGSDTSPTDPPPSTSVSGKTASELVNGSSANCDAANPAGPPRDARPAGSPGAATPRGRGIRRSDTRHPELDLAQPSPDDLENPTPLGPDRAPRREDAQDYDSVVLVDPTPSRQPDEAPPPQSEPTPPPHSEPTSPPDPATPPPQPDPDASA
jgi:hypothetical protein